MSGAPAPTPEDPFAEARRLAAAYHEDQVAEGNVVPLDPTARGAFVRYLADFRLEAVDWLWKDRIPAGELTVIAGDGGLGKSTFAAWLAAQVTTGQMTGLDGTSGVLVALAEDDPARTLGPRYRAAGADLRQVGVLMGGTYEHPGPLVLPEDLEVLAARVEKDRPALLVVDPLTALLDGAVDAHRDGGRGGMRQVLNPLSSIAQAYGTTIVAVFHLNKGAGPAAQRIGGSAGIRNAARNVLVFTAHPQAREAGDDDGRRIIGHDKCNYGPTRPSLDATIGAAPVIDDQGMPVVNKDGEPATTSLLTMGGESDVDYADALRAASENGRGDRPDDALGDATAFLRVELADGEVSVRDLKAAATDAGHAWRTIERAFTELGVKSAKRGSTWVRFIPAASVGGHESDPETPVSTGDLAPNDFSTPPTPSRLPYTGGVGGHDDEGRSL